MDFGGTAGLLRPGGSTEPVSNSVCYEGGNWLHKRSAGNRDVTVSFGLGEPVTV